MYTGNTIAEHDQRDLGGVADSEPQDDQRLEPDDRQKSQHLHRRVDGVLAEPRQAGKQREHGAEGDSDREPFDDPLAAKPRSHLATCRPGAGATCCEERSRARPASARRSDRSCSRIARAPISRTTPSRRSTPVGSSLRADRARRSGRGSETEHDGVVRALARQRTHAHLADASRITSAKRLSNSCAASSFSGISPADW